MGPLGGDGFCPHEWVTACRKVARRMVPMGLRARQQQRRRHREQTVDTVGEGEGGADWERSPETSALPYVKWIAGGFAL